MLTMIVSVMASLAFAAMVGIVLRSFSRYRSGEDVLLAENPKFSILFTKLYLKTAVFG